jgi:hypothetical protein
VFIILLSNRVDPTRANNRVGKFRVQLADAVMSTIRNPALNPPRSPSHPPSPPRRP